MKLRTLVSFVILMLAVSAVGADEFLYWMIDSKTYKSDYVFAALFSAKDGDASHELDYVQLKPDSSPYMISSPVGLYGSEDYSFYIELYAEDYSLAGWSEKVSYDVVRDYIGNSTPTNPKPYYSGWAVNAPEPTSGLLALLGVAAVALRRRWTLV